MEVELELAQIKAKRQQDLRDSGAVSREAYDEMRLRALAGELSPAIFSSTLIFVAL